MEMSFANVRLQKFSIHIIPSMYVFEYIARAQATHNNIRLIKVNHIYVPHINEIMFSFLMKKEKTTKLNCENMQNTYKIIDVL